MHQNEFNNDNANECSNDVNFTLDNDLNITDSSINSNNETENSNINCFTSNENDVMNNNSFLKCLGLNVCGFKSKQIFPDFINFLNKHDVICISESKLADTDTVNIDGYTSFYKNRDKYLHKSGGVLVLIRNNLLENVTVFEELSSKEKIDKNVQKHYKFVNFDLSKSALWFSIRNIDLENDILFCAVYIEGEGSKYYNDNIYNELVDNLTHFNIDNVCFLGDFNSRTAELQDTIPDSICTDDPFNTDNPNLQKRISQDKFANNLGHQLISFCKTSQIAIVNGRLFHDAFLGKKTCKNASVVDYALLSHPLFSLVSDFKVLDFNELFSDVHCLIQNYTYY